MNNIINKLAILLALSLIMFMKIDFYYAILILLIALSLCAFLEYLNVTKYSVIGFCVYLGLSIAFPEFGIMLPLFMYDLFFTNRFLFVLAGIFPLIININKLSPIQLLIIALIIIMAVYLRYQALEYDKIYKDYIRQRDNLTEISLKLEKKIVEQIDNQDVEVNLATMNERNRIAREIHDNVGHLLTSSILQIGAIMAVTKDETTKESLKNVKATLDTGMNSIRNSIHNLHEDSIDLHSQLTSLVNNFNFCDAKLDYEINSPLNVNMKYAIIAIVKEALANIIKHSSATSVNVSVLEHPKLVQLIIVDNGGGSKIDSKSGMGLEGMKQRVSAMNGIINFDTKKGFKIFISFPKGD